MALFTVGELLDVTGSKMLTGMRSTGIEGVTSDSRKASPGDMFVAIKGDRVDGHAFVPALFGKGVMCALVTNVEDEMLRTTMLVAAASCGAALVVHDDPVAALGMMARWYRAKSSAQVVGVTGSVGKTTTKDMIASVLGVRYCTLANEGNLNTQIGVPLTLFRLRPEHQVAVIEMGMRGPGQIAYLADLAKPRVGVITNIGETHLELMGSIENTSRAKAELIDALPADGIAILNKDNPWVVRLGERHPGRKIWYSVAGPADVSATDLESKMDLGMEFTLILPDGVVRVKEPLPGNHNVSNALAAAAVGHAFGMSAEEIRIGLGQLEATGMRSQVVDMGTWTLINDVYNASPASSRAALTVLKDLARGRRTIAVLGDMLELGTYARLGHVEVGQSVHKLGVDILITVGEMARHIAQAAREQGHQHVSEMTDIKEAVDVLKGIIQPHDAVLIKGSRGLHMEDIVDAMKLHYGVGGPVDGHH